MIAATKSGRRGRGPTVTMKPRPRSRAMNKRSSRIPQAAINSEHMRCPAATPSHADSNSVTKSASRVLRTVAANGEDRLQANNSLCWQFPSTYSHTRGIAAMARSGTGVRWGQAMPHGIARGYLPRINT